MVSHCSFISIYLTLSENESLSVLKDAFLKELKKSEVLFVKLIPNNLIQSIYWIEYYPCKAIVLPKGHHLHLCTKCHHLSAAPGWSSSSSPLSPTPQWGTDIHIQVPYTPSWNKINQNLSWSHICFQISSHFSVSFRAKLFKGWI